MSNRPFFGARLEERANRIIARRMRRRGWVETIIPFEGYGNADQLRVLGRVVLTPRAFHTDLLRAADAFLRRRGWRNFMAVPLAHTQVQVGTANSSLEVITDRGGYLDVRIKNPGLEPGRREVMLSSNTSSATAAPITVVDEAQTFGLVSDIDDTVISTWLPRLFIAAWNSLVVTEQARQAVPGMARMYHRLLEDHPGAPIVYISTGAWNTFPFLRRFLKRHGYPEGPMLLTDWGPTNTGWFRSGPEHKRIALRELARDLPHIRWVLIGDDGQHDPALYSEFALLQPDHVEAIVIRQLSMTQQVLAHGTSTVLTDRDQLQWAPDAPPEVRGRNGDVLLPQVLAALGRKRRR